MPAVTFFRKSEWTSKPLINIHEPSNRILLSTRWCWGCADRDAALSNHITRRGGEIHFALFVRMSNILLPSLIKILCVNISSSNPVTVSFGRISSILTVSYLIKWRITWNNRFLFTVIRMSFETVNLSCIRKPAGKMCLYIPK